MEFEVDGPGPRPVPPGLLQHRGEPRVQGLEAQDDECAVVDVVPRGERKVRLDPFHLLVQA